MDSSRRVRDAVIQLSGNTIESLKEELSGILSHISQRQPKGIVLQSHKIPMGFSGFVKAGEEVTAVLPFPLGGVLEDFMSYVPEGCKEVFVQITAVCKAGSQRVETRLLDSFRCYKIQANVSAISYVKIKIMNKTKIDADCIFGFTFKEALPNEIKETRLIGNLEDGTLA